MPVDYATAKTPGILTETDKERFVCCFLNMVDSNAVNWRKASEDFGSASVDSFKKMVASAYKKLNKANADTNGGDAGAGADSLATPKKNKGGRKRKVPDDDGEGESEAKPKKTPKKSTKKAGAENEDDVVKDEEVDDE